MSVILEVENLCKFYPSFRLEGVSFTLRAGTITGFVGRNGAGKSTTLYALLSLVQPDAGNILYRGENIRGREAVFKQRVGFVSAGVSFYAKQKLHRITDVVKTFYGEWNDTLYRRYMQAFALDGNQVFEKLSNGMKIKFALALALSHNAELLILDEPTGGLDPVSREELAEILLDLAGQGKAVLFSTHIISDLDRIADRILYIKNGRILADDTLQGFTDAYRLVQYQTLTEPQRKKIIGELRLKDGYSALIKAADAADFGMPSVCAGAEDIMVHIEKERA
ncbi:MAG: ABC transporter ATP-binding protein [Clostridia bacterium]|nr:ABC transporter ATP-binding protein [Clostridia bacterium]